MPQFEIGLDARMISHTGIGTYTRGLLKGFRDSAQVMPALFTSSKAYVPEGASFSFFDAPIYGFREQMDYRRLVPQCRLWHSPHYNIPYFKGKTKLVVTVHDLIHWVFRKEYFGPHQTSYAWLMLSRTAKLADQIIAVSEHTKHDLIRYFKAEPGKITVIYEAVDDFFMPVRQEEIAPVLSKYEISGPYFLYVGSLKPHKNLLWLISIIRKMRAAGQINSKLVIAGRKDLKYRSGLAELAHIKTDQDLVYIPKFDDIELRALYSGATALIHPSLYEGFGLTPLEAMACHTPVIAAKNASIPEVCGDGACLIDSTSNRDIMQAMKRIETDEIFRHNLKARGSQRVKQFSWTETSKKTRAVYEKALQKP